MCESSYLAILATVKQNNSVAMVLLGKSVPSKGCGSHVACMWGTHCMRLQLAIDVLELEGYAFLMRLP